MSLLKGKKSGITLIEALIVFAAGVGLIAGGLKLYGNLQNTGNIKDETTNISAILKRMNEVFAEDDITSLTMEEMVQAGVFKNMKVIGADAVKNIWNGVVNIDPAAITGTGIYTLTYENVPTGDPCIDLAKATRKMGFDTMSIDGTSEDVSDITINDIISLCENTSTANYVEFQWVK